jgi:prepilin peptidase CpaA
MPTWTAAAVLAALLGAACWTDLRTRRIPNALVVSGAAAGLGLQAMLPAGQGLFAAHAAGAIGAPAALAALALLGLAGLLLWRARLFGAGDAKLLAAVGVYVGPAGALPLLLGTLVSGGALALLALMRRSATRLPYALAIAAGSATHIGWSLLRPHGPA